MIEKVKHIDGLFDANLPLGEFLIINSIWLTLMGLRVNGDLDLLISSKLWNNRFSDKPRNLSFGIPGKYERRLRVHSIDSGPYGKLLGIKDNDDVVYNHRIEIEGLPIVEPSLYFRYKVERFLVLESKLSKIPKWRRISLLGGENNALIKKWRKDYTDFKMLRSYFSKGRHADSNLSKISESEWGLDDEFLLPFILKDSQL